MEIKFFTGIKKKKVAYQAFMGTNYGTILQTFALYKFVESLGYDIQIIGNHTFRHKSQPKSDLLEKKIYDAQLMQYNFSRFFIKHFRFDDVLDDIPLDGTLSHEQTKRIRQYSSVICGSDQVWKPVKAWFYPKRYINYAVQNNINTIGYAPSVVFTDVSQISSEILEHWIKNLSLINYVSCREISSSIFVSSLINRKCVPVVDPTLLFNKDQWIKYSSLGNVDNKLPNLMSKPYLFVYMLDHFPLYKNIIEKIARHYNFSVIYFVGRDIGNPPSLNVEQINTDPLGFIQLIANSKAVICDGFHGSCLSIALKKPFLFFKSPNSRGLDPRLADIVNRFDLYSRVYHDSYDINSLLDVDWEHVAVKLKKHTLKSQEFLSRALLKK